MHNIGTQRCTLKFTFLVVKWSPYFYNNQRSCFDKYSGMNALCAQRSLRFSLVCLLKPSVQTVNRMP